MLRTFLKDRARRIRAPYMGRIRITENIRCRKLERCPNADKGEVHRCDSVDWLLKKDGEYAVKIEYTHKICTTRDPNEIIPNLTLRRQPPSLTSIAAGSLLNHGNCGKLNEEDIAFVEHIFENNPNIMLFRINQCGKVFVIDYYDYDDIDAHEDGIFIPVYGRRSSKKEILNWDLAQCVYDARNFLFHSARSIADVCYNGQLLFTMSGRKRKLSSYDNINKIARLENNFPTKKIKDLEVNINYKITEIRNASTNWGVKVIALIDNNFYIWLPKRVSARLTDHPEEYEALNEDAKHGILFIRFLGGVYNPCEFIAVDEEEDGSE